MSIWFSPLLNKIILHSYCTGLVKSNYNGNDVFFSLVEETLVCPDRSEFEVLQGLSS